MAGARVTDSAHVLQALGVRDALNRECRGTSELYAGGAYKLVAGRLLPNAVVPSKS